MDEFLQVFKHVLASGQRLVTSAHMQTLAWNTRMRECGLPGRTQTTSQWLYSALSSPARTAAAGSMDGIVALHTFHIPIKSTDPDT